MPKVNSIYRLFFALIVCILVGTSVQTQEHPDERQNETRNIERKIEDNQRRQDEIERQLGEIPEGVDRPELRSELIELRNQQEEFHRQLNELRSRPNNGPPPTFIEFIINALKSPAVWAAIITAIGGIIAAWIGIKKRK